jgi:hypothetical protein
MNAMEIKAHQNKLRRCYRKAEENTLYRAPDSALLLQGVRAWAIGKHKAVQTRLALAELAKAASETVVVW